MSALTRVITTCDLCADEGVNTEEGERVSFEALSDRVELDLCGVHRDEIKERLAPYAELTARVNPPMRYNARTRSSGAALHPAKPARRTDLAAVRTWAKAQGLHVSDRGRVPNEVLQKYDAR